MPYLSIIIPIYNSEKYLDACLKSIFKQSFKDYEVIMVDDGSGDSSGEICKKYSAKDKRFRYFKKENGGSYKARLFGAEQASGEFVTFCDSDDYYADKNAFKIIYEDSKRKKYELLQFSHKKKYNHLCKYYKSTDKAVDTDAENFYKTDYPKLLCSFWDSSRLHVNVWDKVYAHSLAEKLPKSETADRVFMGDDLIMNLHMLSDGCTARYIPNVLYTYRAYSGETSRFSINTMKDLDCIKKEQLRYLSEYKGEKTEIIRRILYSEIPHWFVIYLREARKYLNNEELLTLIKESLSLKSFEAAKEYYGMDENRNEEAVNLLVSSDADKYMSFIGMPTEKSIKKSVYNFLKKIYVSI